MANRIDFGSEVVSPTSWPFFGTLMGDMSESNEAALCGATILGLNLAITSATCGLALSDSGKSISSLRLLVGSHARKGDSFRGQVVWALDSCTPGDYSSMASINGANRSQFDFMLIKLEEELNFSANLGAACLVKQDAEDEEESGNHLDKLVNDKEADCRIIAHYAVTSEDVRVKSARVKKTKCWYEDYHDKMNFCFAGKETALTVCKNDSGAPIFCRDKESRWNLVGLVSTVMPDCQDYTRRGVHNVAASMSAMLATGAFQECVDKLGVSSF